MITGRDSGKGRQAMTPSSAGDPADARNDQPAIEGVLSELIEVEQRIEAEVTEAEAGAERLVEAARRDARLTSAGAAASTPCGSPSRR
jgi:hypothetical protein